MLYASDEWDHEVEPGLGPGVEDSSSPFVDADMSAVDHVEGTRSPQGKDDND